MKKYNLLILLTALFLMHGFPVFSQEESPEDPGLILPSILLEIEDLSVEKIDAGLPEEGEIALPERDPLLPVDITPDIREPDPDIDFLTDISAPGPDNPAQGDSGFGTSLIAEGMLGVGNVNSIVSRISFYKPGNLPRYKFLFIHELDDGYGGESTGTGYSSRIDELTASLLLNPGAVELDSLLTFTDRENGLQGQGEYFSVLNRFITSNNKLKLPLAETITLNASMDYFLTSLLLTGGTAPPTYAGIGHYPPTEMLFAPGVKSTFDFRRVTLGLGSNYKFRNVRGSSAYNFNRLYVSADMRIEFPFWLTMNGEVSCFFSNDHTALFPFSVACSGNPSSFFSFNIRGGYFLEENNYYNLLNSDSYLDIPASLLDNNGGFADGTFNINLLRGKLGFYVSSLLRWNSYYYLPSADVGAPRALRQLEVSQDAFSAETGAGFQGNIGESFSYHFGFNNFYLHDLSSPFFKNRLELDLEYTSPGETWGLNAGGILEAGSYTPLNLPRLNLGGYLKATENINISLTLDDCLQPLLGQRVETGPFISPGIKGLINIEIHF